MNKKHATFSIDSQLLEELRRLSFEVRMNKSRLVEDALRFYFKVNLKVTV